MEKQLFDNITDYIFSTQSLVDRINRLFTIKLNSNSIYDSFNFLEKRIDRVELDEVKLLSNPYIHQLDNKIKECLTNYICSVQLLINRLENEKHYTIDYSIKQVEKYEDKLTDLLKENVKHQEMEAFINSWLKIFKNVKLNNQLLKKFKQECIKKGYKQIEILTEMVKRGV